ncbi:MAG: ABC transporter permease [Bacillota bacterium]|nr:ABC transporter permease [Bacillota bacterium]
MKRKVVRAPKEAREKKNWGKVPETLNSNPIIHAILHRRELIVLVLLIVIVVYLQAASGGKFLNAGNLLTMVDRKSYECLVTIGITYLLITKNFDLSVASVMAFSGMSTAYLMVNGSSIPVAIMGGLITGTLVGALNGVLVAKLRVASFIATLGTMYIARSGAQVLSQGSPIGSLPQEFIDMGKVQWLGMPWYFWILIVAVVATQFLLKKHKLFSSIFYIGNNEKASDMVGIASQRITFAMFVISGFIAAFAGIIGVMKSYSASPIAFEGMEMRYIAACVVGGASIGGGQGTIVGSVLGFLLIVLIGNAMTLMGITTYWEGVIFGGILAIAAIADAYSMKRKRTG